MERTYTIPLRRGFRNAARYKKTNRAVATLIAFIERHMKSDDVRVGQHLNSFLWKNGARNPPPRVTVTAVKDDDGVVRVELEGKKYKESVKPKPKEESGTLKDKIAQTLGGKKGADESEAEKQGTEKPAEKKAVSPKKPQQASAAQPSPQAAKPATKSPTGTATKPPVPAKEEK
ncbi:hypothetical protein D6789_03540 [Candidatus Woesearchaeota archaeon]|nr:MAG: hypothetical protein D6789_03540 [Candidatus Woesearchaeota archaeon]